MQLFSYQDMFNAAWLAISTAWEIKGAYAQAVVDLVLLPFQEFSIEAALIAAVWAYVLWKNKGLLISGVSHALHMTDWAVQIIKPGSR